MSRLTHRCFLLVLLGPLATVAAADPPPLVRLGSDRFRQPERVMAITYSQDGRQLATAGEGFVHIWDAADGRQLQSLKLGQFVTDLRYTDGNRTLLAAADDGVNKATDLYRINPTTGKVISKARVFDGQSSAGHFSPDGAWLILLACEYKRGYQFIDTATGKFAWAQPMEGDSGHTAHAFRPDGKMLAVAENDGRILIRDPATGKVLHQFRLTKKVVTGMVYSPDGNDLVIRFLDPKANRIIRVAAETGTERWSQAVEGAEDLAFASDGQAVRYREPRLNVYEPLLWRWLDARTGKPLDRTMDTEPGFALTTRPDGKVLAVGGFGGLISQWDLATGQRQEAASAEPPEDVTELRFNADGTKLRGWARGWYEWDTKTGKQTRLTPNLDRWMNRLMTVSDDQKWLARVLSQGDGNTGALELIDLTTHRVQPTGLPSARYHGIRFARDGRLVITDDGGIKVVEPATGKRTVEIPWDNARQPTAITNDGTLAMTMTPAADRIYVARWDLKTGKPAGSWESQAHDPQQSALAGWAGRLSSNGAVFAASFHGAYLSDPPVYAGLYNARTGRLLSQWTDGQVFADLAFSRDSRAICVYPSKSGVEVREVATGGRRTFRSAKDWSFLWSIRAAAFSPDGSTVALAHSPGPIALWDLIGKPTGTWADQKPARSWDALAGDDAERAFTVIRHLRHYPAEAVGFLKERMKVPAVPDAAWVAARINGLDAPLFRDRRPGRGRRIGRAGAASGPGECLRRGA